MKTKALIQGVEVVIYGFNTNDRSCSCFVPAIGKVLDYPMELIEIVKSE